MNYIVFDLEWNNVYNYKTKQGTNEIIEIGAVKLDNKLQFVDSFKVLIKPQLSNKLGKRFKDLTGITKEEVFECGISFDEAFDKFEQWCGDDDNLFLSWSNSDLFTLVSNFRLFKGTSTVSFMHKYADAQKYCMSFFDDASGSNQIGLSDCAKRLNINTDDYSLHRALEDCYIASMCFKNLYDESLVAGYINICDYDYFERLTFKKFFVTKPVFEDFNVNEVKLNCLVCGGIIDPIKEYYFENNSFKSAGKCRSCEKKFWINIRAKKTYDEIIVSKRLVPINKRKSKHIN